MADASLADFLRRALVWPDPNSPSGWVNLHWRRPDQKGITGGQACKTPEDVLGFTRWAVTKGKPYVSDLYYCTSLQEEHGDPKQNGRFAALRSIDNAVSSRLLFADVDKYASKVEAARALKEFSETSHSPYPTALVDSGGGLHAYWMLPEPFAKNEWLELAHRHDGLMNAYGLKHDNISTDMARILRLPETFNYKRMGEGIPPAPVVLRMLNDDVDLHSWQSLLDATPTPALVRATTIHPSSVPLETLFVKVADAASGPPRGLIGKIPLEEQVGEGTVEPAPVFRLCPMFAETIHTGGQNVGQPVWHQQALASTFLFGGRELFHDLGRKHIGYSRESSDEMYHRKLRDRATKGLGYPSCAIFERDGATQCSTCPLKGKVTSPLNITEGLERSIIDDMRRKIDGPPIVVHDNANADWSTPITKITQIVNVPARELFSTPPPANLGLPELPDDDPSLRYEDGFIMFTEMIGKKKIEKKLFYSKILEAKPFRMEKGKGIGLRVVCTSGVGEEAEIILPVKAFRAAAAGVYDMLNDEGCLMNNNAPKVTELMQTFRGRMALADAVQRVVPFGWEYATRADGAKQGDPLGFSYGGTVYMPDGKTRPTFGADPHLEDVYRVTGEIYPWLDALGLVIGMRSPGLQTVVLSAFAAPLMIFSGQPSTIVMVRGHSGGSKSTASAVACAVWAEPRRAMMKPSSSKLGVMRRMGKIRHLPTIWDDIRNEQFETVKDTLMEITQGGDGLKLDQNRAEREQGVWDNMLLTSSNNSLVEYLEGISKNDGAALVRCFEFEVPPIFDKDQAYVDPNTIATLIAALDFNHGHLGREYAAILGLDPPGLRKMYKAVSESFAKKIKPYQPHERFWMAAAATILMAGQLANTLPSMQSRGLRFNLAELELFLVSTYLDLRERHGNANIHTDTAAFAKHYLGKFINTYASPRNEIVWTIDKPEGRGRPDMVQPIWPVGDAARRVSRVSVRWLVSSRKLLVSKDALDTFVRLEKASPDRMKDGLLRFFKATILPRSRMAAGITNVAAQAQEVIYEIEVRRGTELDDQLQLHATTADQQKIVPPQPERTPDQSATHQQPGQTGLVNGKDAS